jgi:hypothetical protein
MSTVYILGAGFSMPFGYPSSRHLLCKLNKFVLTHGAFDSELKNKWERCWIELGESKDDAVRCAFEGRNIEELLTVLDFYQKLKSNRFSDSADEWASTMDTSGKGSVGKENEKRFQRANALSDKYTEHRDTLLKVLQAFFLVRHHQDHANWSDAEYNDLKRFAQRVQPGDTVLTFNYDALAERALLACEKWAPHDGYGFEVNLESKEDPCLCTAYSPVKVLHLHGFIGWYDGASAADPSSLDSDFLANLGCQCKPTDNINSKYPNIIAPSYIKTYVTHYWDGTKVAELWAKAIQAIQDSSKVVIIGYSLPEADSAAMTLFLGISGKTVEVVNPNVPIERNIRNLLEQRCTFVYHSTGKFLWENVPDYNLSSWLNEQDAQATQCS